MSSHDSAGYWSANLKLIGTMLVVWFVVSFGCGILLADALNSIRIGGYQLGFWFAQQGSMYTFLALVFIYKAKMDKIDQQFGAAED